MRLEQKSAGKRYTARLFVNRRTKSRSQIVLEILCLNQVEKQFGRAAILAWRGDSLAAESF